MLRSELKGEMLGMRGELKGEMSEMRGEHEATGSALRGELRAEIQSSASSVTRQMYVALLGQMAVLLGIAYFFVTHVTV